ncbi:MAG TPA: type II toxin-antitoxin system prevent-host-death family antitoxin [Chloroflexota bacterium]|nr:type II toxin-antitoxin system prevent-host-death family antitoxin [Chloroflexota bacterium]
MEKSVGAFEIRRQFGRILQEVAVKGDSYIVERHGEPVAVVVPVDVYEQWKRGREAFFERMNLAAERAAMAPAEADELANAAVEAIRAETAR